VILVFGKMIISDLEEQTNYLRKIFQMLMPLLMSYYKETISFKHPLSVNPKNDRIFFHMHKFGTKISHISSTE